MNAFLFMPRAPCASEWRMRHGLEPNSELHASARYHRCNRIPIRTLKMGHVKPECRNWRRAQGAHLFVRQQSPAVTALPCPPCHARRAWCVGVSSRIDRDAVGGSRLIVTSHAIVGLTPIVAQRHAPGAHRNTNFIDTDLPGRLGGIACKSKSITNGSCPRRTLWRRRHCAAGQLPGDHGGKVLPAHSMRGMPM